MNSLHATLVLTFGCLGLAACGSQTPDNEANAVSVNAAVNEASSPIAPPEAETDQSQETQAAKPKPAEPAKATAPAKASPPTPAKRDTPPAETATAQPKPTTVVKPKTEATPPASTCTPEHRAMGHC